MTHRLDIDLDTAEELLAHLSAVGPHFRDSAPGRWIFRGERCSSWNLIPSAFRDHTKLFPGFFVRHIRTLWDDFANWPNSLQIASEARTLAKYAVMLDRNGSGIPEESPSLRDLLNRILHDSEFLSCVTPWIPPVLRPLAGMAQHFGLATRLLDWTYSARKAAFFAVEEFARNEPPVCSSSRFGVWAYCTALYRFQRKTDRSISLEPKPDPFRDSGLVLIATPTVTNPNLRAQEGLHMLCMSPQPLVLEDPADRPSLEDAIQHEYSLFADVESRPILLKFTLPYEQAPRLLHLLAVEGITAATIYPDRGGAARAVLDERSLALLDEEFWY